MKHVAWPSRLLALVMFLAVLAWAGWLWHARKTVMDYLTADVLRGPSVPFCRWLPINAPGIASIGLDTTSNPVWTYAKTAAIVFRTGSRQPWYVDVRMIAAAGSGISLSIDGGPARYVSKDSLKHEDVLRLLPAWDTRDGLHVVRIDVANPRPPSGQDQRWLGLAISRIKVCDSLTASP
ncbi:MAG: hypothetical protein JSR56_06250 [Proteobacteria bacterium]|nr:hypothetical protein [Pseudomonadota bacterium]